MDGTLPLICPECRRPGGSPDATQCSEHGIYLVPAEVADQVDDHPLIGQLLDDKYALIGVLGSGGFGTVYRALQQPLNRPVALKVLINAALAQKQGRERFEREAHALARLTSPYTVRFVDFGVTRTGGAGLRNLPYLVMELLDGVPLEQRQAESPLTFGEIEEVITAIGDSLTEAHALGIVHRDLKPSNVILTRNWEDRLVPRVIDFGIARMEGGMKSQTGLLVGTPLYMAPEQARGDSVIDGRADVYALAVIAFELLAGKPPFGGETAIQILKAQIQAPIPTLESAGAPAGLRKLNPVLARGLSKAPADRFASPAELAKAIAAGLREAGVRNNEQPAAAPTAAKAPPRVGAFDSMLAESTASPAEEPRPRRERTAIIVGVTVALAATAAIVVSRLVGRGPPPAAAQLQPVVVQALPARMPASAAAEPPEPVPAALAPATTAPAATAPATTLRPPIAQNAIAAPVRPRTVPKVPPPTKAVPTAALKEIEDALLACRCDSARKLIERTGRQGVDASVLSRLSARAAMCRPLDVDHKCVDGRLVEVE